MPAAGLVGCGFFAVAVVAQASTVLWVVGVESELFEVSSAVWMVVGDGCWCELADGADLGSFEDCGSECFVVFVVVAACGGCASCPVGSGGVGLAPGGGGDLWAVWDVAYP